MVQICKNLYKNAIIAVILCTNSRAFLYSSLFCTLQRQQNTTLVFTCPAVQSIKDDQTFTNHMLRLFSPVSKNVKKKRGNGQNSVICILTSILASTG